MSKTEPAPVPAENQQPVVDPALELSSEDRAKAEEAARLAGANAQKPAVVEPAPGSIDEEAAAAIKDGKLKTGESLEPRVVATGRLGGAPVADEGPRPVLAPADELPTDFAQRLSLFEAAVRELDDRINAVARRMVAEFDGLYATERDPQPDGKKLSVAERVANLETKLKNWL